MENIQTKCLLKMPNSQNRKYPNKMPNSQPTLRKKRSKT